MCLAIPGKIIEIRNNDKGIVDLGGITKEVSLAFIPDAQKNDWIIIHTGFGLQIISEKEASETIQLLRQIKNLEDK